MNKSYKFIKIHYKWEPVIYPIYGDYVFNNQDKHIEKVDTFTNWLDLETRVFIKIKWEILERKFLE